MTLAASLSLALSLAVPAAAADPGPALPYPVQQHVLENGLQVVFVRHPTPGVAAFLTMFRVGSRNEVEPGRTGFAHFLEHLAFRGSKHLTAEQWDRATKEMGAETNAFTDDDLTAYWLVGPAAALPRIIELEADRLMNLQFGEDDFRTEARAVLGELLKDLASPDFAVDEHARRLAFTRHTYQHTTMGFEKDVRDMPSGYRSSLELYRRFYRPDNATVFVVGQFDEERALAEIRSRFGAWRGRGEPPRVPAEPPQREAREERVEWPAPILPRSWSGWHTPGAADLDATATQLVLWPYLFGRPSALHRELVLERHLAEQIAGEYQPHRDPFLFGLELVLESPDAEATARAAVDRAVAELAGGRVDERLLADVQANVRRSLLMDSDTPYRTAVWLASYTGLTGDPGTLDAVMARVARVTSGDLVAFARQWLVPENRTTVLVANPVRTERSEAESKAGPAAGGAR